MPEKIIRHYGVPGMKWGHRKARDTSPTTVVTSQKPGSRVKATGGKNQPASEDAIKSAAARQQARASTTDSLSTKDLQALVQRMNLEQQYVRLTTPQKSPARQFVDNLLGIGKTMNDVAAFKNSPSGKAMKNTFDNYEPKKRPDKIKDLIDFHANTAR